MNCSGFRGDGERWGSFFNCEISCDLSAFVLWLGLLLGRNSRLLRKKGVEGHGDKKVWIQLRNPWFSTYPYPPVSCHFCPVANKRLGGLSKEGGKGSKVEELLLANLRMAHFRMGLLGGAPFYRAMWIDNKKISSSDRSSRKSELLYSIEKSEEKGLL